jgi:hypothetical protein
MKILANRRSRYIFKPYHLGSLAYIVIPTCGPLWVRVLCVIICRPKILDGSFLVLA